MRRCFGGRPRCSIARARWCETMRAHRALGIGLFLGLAVLTRPTKILYGLVLGAAVLAFGTVVIRQLLFWRTMSG